MIVAFDVDGTLISEADDSPRVEIIDLLVKHHNDGDTVVVWSGGGVDYAQRWVFRLKLSGYVDEFWSKGRGRVKPDLTYDDMVINLGAENVCVGTGDGEERW